MLGLKRLNKDSADVLQLYSGQCVRTELHLVGIEAKVTILLFYAAAIADRRSVNLVSTPREVKLHFKSPSAANTLVTVPI